MFRVIRPRNTYKSRKEKVQEEVSGRNTFVIIYYQTTIFLLICMLDVVNIQGVFSQIMDTEYRIIAYRKQLWDVCCSDYQNHFGRCDY